MSKSEAGLVYTVGFTFIICFVFVFVLSLTNLATEEIVLKNGQIKQQGAILRAMGIEVPSEEQILIRFQEIEQEQRDGFILYRGIIGGDEIYVKEFQGAGLWGTITGAIGIDPIAGTISGLEIISHNETPGLGARIDQPWFKDQLRGEKIINNQIRMTSRRGVGDEDNSNGEIDGVSGATRTSESIVRIINNELQLLINAL